MSVLDAHQHLGSLPTGPSPERADRASQRDLGARLEVMDRLGIDQTLILGANGYLRPDGAADTREWNDQILAYTRLAPDRLIAAVGIAEPLHGPASLAEVRRLADLGFAGLAFHTRFQGVALDHPWVSRLVAEAAAARLLVFVHLYRDSTLESPLALLRLAQDHPEVPFVALDAGGSLEHVRQCELVARLCPNVVFETSMMYGHMFPGFVEKLGAHRVLFGTNTYSDPELPSFTALGPEVIRGYVDDPEARSRILGGNLRALLEAR